MNILIYGAGVLGSRYAMALTQAGHQVTLLARGQRLEQLRQHGVVLQEIGSEEMDTASLPVIDHLDVDTAFDLVLVMLRANQVSDVLPALAANQHTPNVLFLGNNIDGSDALVKALGAERVLMGFAGAGGLREGHIVRYMRSRRGATYVGELDGSLTERLQRIVEAFEDTPFPVKIVSNIEAWLKCHVALVSPMAYALYMSGGDNHRLARTRDALVLMLRAIREGLKAMRQQGMPILPPVLGLIVYLPEPLLVPLLRMGMNSRRAEVNIAGHANAARDEMRFLADGLWKLVQESQVAAPSLKCLYAYANPKQPPISEGSQRIAMDWKGIWVGLGMLAGSITLITFLKKKLFPSRKQQ
jgi:2-dehydropantoate 2-reductase